MYSAFGVDHGDFSKNFARLGGAAGPKLSADLVHSRVGAKLGSYNQSLRNPSNRADIGIRHNLERKQGVMARASSRSEAAAGRIRLRQEKPGRKDLKGFPRGPLP